MDALTQSLGNIAYYYHGRMIENARIGNNTDAYTINGWESEKIENHSGIVDCFRNPKGNPQLLAYYNQPLYVAVKLRTKITHAPASVVADFHIVNEVNLHGPHTLSVWLEDAAHAQLWMQDYPVNVSGGDTYGELLAERIQISVTAGPGTCTVAAELRDSHGRVVAVGRDTLLVVDWRGVRVPIGGALLDSSGQLDTFLVRNKDAELLRYNRKLAPLSYVVVGDFNPIPRDRIPAECFTTKDGKHTGLSGQYYHKTDLTKPSARRVDADIHIDAVVQDPASVVPGVPTTAKDFSVRWQGLLKAPQSGNFIFHAETDDGLRMWVGDQLVIDDWREYAWWHEDRPLLVHGKRLRLEEGQVYPVKIEYWQAGGEGQLKLYWTTPSDLTATGAIAHDLIRRVHDDGTTLIILDHTWCWAQLLGELGAIKYHGWLHGKRHWLGSNFFVRAHPLFADLPANKGMSWRYQEFAEYGAKRYGLMLEDEEAVVGIVSDHQHAVGTAVGIVRYGRGRIVLSTLNILEKLNDPRGPCEVVRKVFCNYLAYAGAHAPSDAQDDTQ